MAVILASTSTIRRQLLSSAGIEFTVVSPAVDETMLKSQNPGAAPERLASLLAAAKASAVSRLHPKAVVIGADQVLALDGKSYDKPRTMEEAAGHLSSLRGKTHHLHTAVCCARGENLLWQHCAQASLTMRSFSSDFLDGYLTQIGRDALTSVGAYKLEGRGVQLFSAIAGDHFAILGLPLLPLLEFLRSSGELAV